MKRLAALFLIVGGIAACSPNSNPDSYAADNSGQNAEDSNVVTSGDQSNAKADIAITQAIRQAVVADDSLSTNAQNVKIITANGVVTLRGPVGSVAEKDSIDAKAKQVAGVSRVVNQLEIASN